MSDSNFNKKTLSPPTGRDAYLDGEGECPKFSPENGVDKCNECQGPAFKVQRDAANYKHTFCERCWNEHVAFGGNKGKAYSF